MFKCQKNKFWLEKPINLFCTLDIIPLDDMSIAEQMNALTRLVVLVYFILSLVGFKYSLLFLLISLLLIIILYYIQRNQMRNLNTEHYKSNLHDFPKPNKTGIPNEAYIFCDDTTELPGPNGTVTKDYMSINQKLVGTANPKTFIAPIITPHIADLEYWKTNNMVTNSAINDETQIDLYQSGYMISEPCSTPQHNSYPSQNQGYYQTQTQGQNQPRYDNQQGQNQENFTMPFIREPLHVKPNEPGWVNTACGYNPDQLEQAGLPTNLASGSCSQDPSMKQHNQNLFTNIIQPGLYSTNEIVEPVNSMMGISFQQQFPPTTTSTDPVTGDVLYTHHDPRIMEPITQQPRPPQVTTDNIYDPRHNGYGTSYRSYTEDVTGQTRFFYDDINSIRMPNYISRSNIDNQPYADQYGPIQPSAQNGNPMTRDIRSMANQSWVDNSINFRSELQERLMRKNNARQWQLRQSPISTQKR